MVRNYLGFFLGLWLVLSPAWAAEVLVGELTLSHAPPWQRGAAAEEDSENSAILRWQADGESMTVFLPHHQVELKADEDRFYRQLEQKWRALYGAEARVYPMELAETKWRVCRRPSLNGDATVFQLVTVHEGRAHHLLVIAPGRMQALPDAAERLIASAAWGSVRSVVFARDSQEELLQQNLLPLTAPVAPEPEAATATAVAEPTLPQGEVAVAPTPTPLPPVTDKPWRLDRVIHAVPKGAGLATLADAESSRLGRQAVLSGYGFTRQEHGIKGFLEGYAWQEVSGKRFVRKGFTRRWQTQWQAPAEIRPGEQDWSVTLLENSLEGESGQMSGMNVRLDLMALCGPRDALVATVNALDGETAVGDRLSGLSSACRVSDGVSPAATLRLQPGDIGEKALQIKLPPAWAARDAGGDGAVKRLVIVASHPPATPEPGLGDWLLAGARSYFIYAPQE